jgi:hypothetical protein
LKPAGALMLGNIIDHNVVSELLSRMLAAMPAEFRRWLAKLYRKIPVLSQNVMVSIKTDEIHHSSQRRSIGAASA